MWSLLLFIIYAGHFHLFWPFDSNSRSTYDMLETLVFHDNDNHDDDDDVLIF